MHLGDDSHAGAAELFNRAATSFREGDVEDALAYLRRGFYENLYIAPALLGEQFVRQDIWYDSSEAEPQAAMDYVSRFGRVWSESDSALDFLAEVWTDPVVRRELRNYINHSKAVLQSRDPGQRQELLRERNRFADWRRILGTQSEILGRLELSRVRRPMARPRIAEVSLASPDPTSSVEFFRKLFGMDPLRTSREARGYALFELPGIRLIVHGHDQVGDGDPYGLGPAPKSFGWGAVFVVRVREIDRYYENAVKEGVEIVDRDLRSSDNRFFVVKEPSGYLFEITEDDSTGV